eukprot:CAMPEP_0177632272 /NCGR_PEP_ID=MMETSP0447-20121125/2200_1 /TAXON_ID=0 /ORGANISM="Stygamoeba regulata, Strain BSH-02190019" /LENGTH=198 /DNA_ID=CAMNT_0019133823 /DNA_START=68 /DNA_END=661 /DNA_ORIENTATION=-
MGLLATWAYWRFYGTQFKVLFAVFALINLSLFCIRISVGKVNGVYLIHSIVIFFDLLFANLFSSSWKFNGFLVLSTIFWMLLYLFYNELWMELLETVVMAVATSAYDIWRHHSHKKFHRRMHAHESGDSTLESQRTLALVDEEAHGTTLSKEEIIHARNEVKEESFRFILFEQFLDGSSGVLYTSFIGIVLGELLTIW